VQDAITHKTVPLPREAPEDLGFKPEHVAIVRKAMVGVTQAGTSTRVFAGAAYLSGGKTGTAQAVGIGQKDKYNASKMEEHQRDHALYIAFAPADDPKIALAAVVENAGFGAAHAAPIARRIFDYWLLGQYPSEEDLAAVRVGKAQAPMGKPRNAADVAWPPEGGAPASAATAAAAIIAPVAAATDPAAKASSAVVAVKKAVKTQAQ
jgi:penicillin-binding protein 2